MIVTFIGIIYSFLFEDVSFLEIIQSPSVDPLNQGSSVNLTCSAKLTNPKYEDWQLDRITWWLNGKKVHSCPRQYLHANGVMSCTLTLGGRLNQLKAIGNFSCKASNVNNQCILKRIELKASFGKHVIQVFTYVLRRSTWPGPRLINTWYRTRIPWTNQLLSFGI